MATKRDRVWIRLTALGFALGGSVHLTALLLLASGVELYGHGYPAWRHLAMATVDWLIAWVAVARTPLLVFALLAFGVEQVLVNGVSPVAVLVFIAAAVVAWERWPPVSAHGSA